MDSQAIGQVLLANAGQLPAIREAMVAEAIRRDPDLGSKGQRAISIASGVERKLLHDVLPQDGEISEFGLLECKDRGASAFSEESRYGSYVFTDKRPDLASSNRATHAAIVKGASLYKDSSSDPYSLNTEIEDQEVNGGVSSPIAEEDVEAILAPGLDVWAPSKSSSKRTSGTYVLGPRLWAIAYLVDCADVELDLADLTDLLGLAKAMTTRLVTDLAKLGLAERHKVGRKTRVELRFRTCLLDKHSEWYLGIDYQEPAEARTRADDQARRHREDSMWTAALNTPAGRTVWAILKDLDGFIASAQETGAPPEWLATLRRGDKWELYSIMKGAGEQGTARFAERMGADPAPLVEMPRRYRRFSIRRDAVPTQIEPVAESVVIRTHEERMAHIHALLGH